MRYDRFRWHAEVSVRKDVKHAAGAAFTGVELELRVPSLVQQLPVGREARAGWRHFNLLQDASKPLLLIGAEVLDREVVVYPSGLQVLLHLDRRSSAEPPARLSLGGTALNGQDRALFRDPFFLRTFAWLSNVRCHVERPALPTFVLTEAQVGANRHRQYTVPLCLGVRDPGIAELRSIRVV
eukprot:scaffold1035_cov63-Phaeocystis_antarctica.AAC.3